MIDRLTTRIPGATIAVYDNYNALAVGWWANDRLKSGVLSLAVFPRWVTLCFIQDAPGLPDPHKLLSGTGNQVRHVRLSGPEMLDDPRIEALIAAALDRAAPPIDPAAPGGLLIKSISAKQRPRRPA